MYTLSLRDSEKLRGKKLTILAELAHAGFCNVDLVFMKENDIVLQYEAVRQNILVYETENFDRGATYSVVVRKYLDFCYFLNVQREAYKERILHDKSDSSST